MRIRLGLHHRFTAADDAACAALGETCAAAEAAGLAFVWLSDAPAAAANVLAAAATAATSRLRTVVEWRSAARPHALRIAEDAAALDGLSGGRIEVSLRAAPEEAPETLVRFVTAMRAGWTGEEAPAVAPRPRQRPHPPLWIAVGILAAGAEGAPDPVRRPLAGVRRLAVPLALLPGVPPAEDPRGCTPDEALHAIRELAAVAVDVEELRVLLPGLAPGTSAERVRRALGILAAEVLPVLPTAR